MRQLPQEKIVYFGDTARAPYGSRPAEDVRKYTVEIVGYLMQFNPKMIVIACNTATAVALEDIRSRVSVPVVGVIHPGAQAAIEHTKTDCIGVIGTEGTIRSGAYVHALTSLAPRVKIVSLACPSFVPLVERGNFRTGEARAAVRLALSPLRQYEMDCLILGCTHYPFLADAIGDVMGERVKLINSADYTAREIKAILDHNGGRVHGGELVVHRFFCSGEETLFKSIAEQWLEEQFELTPVVWQVPRIG